MSALIKKDDGFYLEGRAKPTYTYIDLPRCLRFEVPDWTLHVAIKSDEQVYAENNAWDLIRPRRASMYEMSEDTWLLPMQFSRPAEITVSAMLQMEPARSLEIIDEGGCRPFDGKMHLSISASEIGGGSVWHSLPTDSNHPDLGEEAIYWTLKLPHREMEWLHAELTRCPGASLKLGLDFAAYQSVGESFGIDSWMQQTFALEPDSWTPIVEAKVTVSYTAA
ncbi:hypothetical protein FHR22_001887 [Sphingopyxis panaciterrae]|uniref:hypothetical protein n=1 Tax=Sphingopyxis panaciterrae TaxID=363841 RepID=UPI001422E6E7|nr:hypothetical protein [Sphingopyxis panaciterrae]NIJ37203.1 hypothetical protein [Sphingopyxis panaciterrae]